MYLSRRVHRAPPVIRVRCPTSDAVTDGNVTKKARVNYEQIIREKARSAGHDNDDKGLN